jgi:patatin-like phospholipase/acyl hydrolase
MPKTVKVLSIDGGGIRGIIPALILAQIEQITQKPISSLFDLVAGTSTGGILGLSLVKPGNDGKPAYSAQNMIDLYEKEGPKIFSRNMLHQITSLGNIADEKYPSSGIEDVLERYFGDTRLKDALTDVVVTSYEIERRISWFFKSTKAKLNPEVADFSMKEVARSTSAAPTYFEANKVSVKTEAEYYSFIDGGVYANNPAMCAYVEAKNKFPDADKILIVSLGTGMRTQRIPYDKAKDWGLAQWVQPLLGVVFDGVDNTVDYQLNTLLSGSGDYFRFQTRLDEGSDEMDNASDENIRVLKLLAERLIREKNDDLQNLCNRLLSE